jgi:hypothetical protein
VWLADCEAEKLACENGLIAEADRDEGMHLSDLMFAYVVIDMIGVRQEGSRGAEDVLREYGERTRQLLTTHWAAVEAVAEALLDKDDHTLDGARVQKIIDAQIPVTGGVRPNLTRKKPSLLPQATEKPPGSENHSPHWTAQCNGPQKPGRSAPAR